jgi:hypothetical protein
MLNGAVIGITPWLRYIVLTDALLESLDEAEVEAVAAHEVAHVRKRHMLWLALAVIGAALLFGEGAALALERAGLPGPLAVWVAAAGSLVAVLLVLGAVSRRFEWQADAFAARHLSRAVGGGETGEQDTAELDTAEQENATITEAGAQAMSTALGRVARLNGFPETRFTWRHGSIATRRKRLLALVGTPAARLPIDRGVRRVMLVTLHRVRWRARGSRSRGSRGSGPTARADPSPGWVRRGPVPGATEAAPLGSGMQLSETEQKIAGAVASRADALLEDLKLHVGLPTGGGNKAALDETRERFVSRLERLGARTDVYPGDDKPSWLHGVAPGATPPPTAVCRRLKGDMPRVLIAGHLDTVHDPKGDFRSCRSARREDGARPRLRGHEGRAGHRGRGARGARGGRRRLLVVVLPQQRRGDGDLPLLGAPDG